MDQYEAAAHFDRKTRAHLMTALGIKDSDKLTQDLAKDVKDEIQRLRRLLDQAMDGLRSDTQMYRWTILADIQQSLEP